MGSNNSPIRITVSKDRYGDIENFHATFNFAVHREPTDGYPDIIWASPVDISQLNPLDPNGWVGSPTLIDKQISVTPPLVALRTPLQDLATERFRLNHQFSMAENLIGGFASSGLGLVDGIIWGTFTSAIGSATAIQDHNLTLHHWDLSDYHRELALEANIITTIWLEHETGSMYIPHILTWPTALTPTSLDALNSISSGPDVSWNDFLQDDNLGLNTFVGLSQTAADRLMRLADSNRSAAQRNIPDHTLPDHIEQNIDPTTTPQRNLID